MNKILVQAENVNKSYGSKLLYSEANFSIYEGEKIALYGPNGSGKSSLFKMIALEEEQSSGQFHSAKGLVISYLKQSHKDGLNLTPNKFLEDKEQSLASWDVKKIASGLGFGEELFETELGLLSGGYRMRFYLACELARSPDLLLLDEPTNHLDLESVLFLESYLRSYKKCFVLISHDRELIENLCDSCLVIENQEILKFKGSLEAYFEFSKEQKEHKLRENKKIEDKKKHLEAFVEKFRAKATKAKQAQSKIKQIAKMDSIHNIPIEYFPALPIPQAKPTGKIVSEAICKSGLGYDESRIILKQFEFHIFRGDKIAIVGENGAGKSTLLKFLASKLLGKQGEEPKLYKNVEASYFAQHLEAELPLKKSLLDYIADKIPKDITEQEILNLLGSMGFHDADWDKEIGLFSGGERMRIVLSEILLKKQALLLLDEPTNHLDFQTVESLAQALKQTDCSVILVSHDRSFVDQVCDKIFEISGQELKIYPGSYQDYVWAKKSNSSQNEMDSETSKLSSEGSQNKPKQNYKSQRKDLEKKIRMMDKEITSLEKKIQSSDKEIEQLNQDLIDSPAKAGETAKLLHAKGNDKNTLEESWLDFTEKLESLKNELNQLLG